MPEEVSAFVGREGVENLADPRPQVVDRAFARLSQGCLELGECELDGVEVGRIWRQEKEVRAPRLDETAGLVPLMTAQVVEDDDVARLERRREDAL